VKLLYVVHQFFPECRSGTEQYSLATAREARRRGDEVTVLSLHPWLHLPDPALLLFDEPYDGLRVLRLRHWEGLNPNDVLRDYHNPAVAELFRRVVEQERPDAVHFFHLRRLGSDLIAAAREAGARTVVHLMDFWYLCPRFTLLRADGALCEGPPDGGLGCVPCAHPELADAWSEPKLEPLARDAALAARRLRPSATPAARFAALIARKDVQLERLAAADAIVAPSRFLAAMFERNGFPAQRIAVIPYGLEPDRVQRRAIARPRRPLRLAFLGVLSPWKAPHLAIAAMRALAGDDRLRLRLHGNTNEGMFADYIAQTIASAERDPRIEFAGAFERDQLDAVLADTDALIVPSLWYENTPFVILEAFAAGVPVIASDLGGMAELVRAGENGLLFEAGNVSALASVLRACVEDPDELARLRPEPVGTIADNYARFRELYAGH
jgi:glycosyltransferase involved in cell wall biosynthesis